MEPAASLSGIAGMQIPPDDVLVSWYKLRIRESEKLKTVLKLYNLEITRRKQDLIIKILKTVVKRSTDQKIRLRNFDARNERIETGTAVTNRRVNVVFTDEKWNAFNGKQKGQCSRAEKCSFRHAEVKRTNSRSIF